MYYNQFDTISDKYEKYTEFFQLQKDKGNYYGEPMTFDEFEGNYIDYNYDN